MDYFKNYVYLYHRIMNQSKNNMCLRLKNITYPQNKVDMTLKEVFNKLLKELHQDRLFYQTTSKTDMQHVGFRFIHMLSQTNICDNIEAAYALLKNRWGIESSDNLKVLIEQYALELKKAGYTHINMLKRPTKRSPKHISALSGKFKFTPVKRHERLKNQSRAIVCRGMHGNYGYKIYEITGSITCTADKDTMLNEIKMQFHYDTGCPYYEVRPILWTSWCKLSPEKQIGTK